MKKPKKREKVEGTDTEAPDNVSIEYTESNIVDLKSIIVGNAQLIVNGDHIDGDPDSPNKVIMTLHHEGDVLTTIDGEDFMVEEEE